MPGKSWRKSKRAYGKLVTSKIDINDAKLCFCGIVTVRTWHPVCSIYYIICLMGCQWTGS